MTSADPGPSTIRHVAERAGVSPGTVSNVLNRPGRVSPETSGRVLEAIAALGYVRHGSASALRTGRSSTVGLIVRGLGNPYTAEVIRGVEETLNARGHALILCNSENSREREARNLGLLVEHQAHGVIIAPVGAPSAESFRHLPENLRVVMLDRRVHGHRTLAVDDRAGAELAVAHLLARGARDIAYVTGPVSLHPCAERRRGARRAAAPAPLREVVVPGMTVAAGAQAAGRLLEDPPDAVFCANDLLALGLLGSLLRAGVRVPEDVLLIGYDDIPFAEAADVPLSTVRRPAYELGEAAATAILDREPGTDPEEIRILRPALIIRNSTS